MNMFRNDVHTWSWMEMLDETGKMTGESNFGSEEVNAVLCCMYIIVIIVAKVCDMM